MLLTAAVDLGDYFWANGEKVPLLRVISDNPDGSPRPVMASSSALRFTGPVARWQDRLVGIAPGATRFQLAGGDEEVELTREIYVALNGADPASLFQRASGYRDYQPVPGTSDHYLVTLAAGPAASLVAANVLQGAAGVAFAHPNFVVHGWTTTNDPLFARQWNLQNDGQSGGTIDADIDAPEAWATTTGRGDIVVAVLDVGFQINHPDLMANIFRNDHEIPGNGIDDDGNGWIDDVNGLDLSLDNPSTSVIEHDGDPSPANANDNHGTAVAGVVAAAGDNSRGISGVAPGVTILPIKIGTSNSSGGFSTTVASLAAAVYYAAGRTADGSGTWRGADVANHSYGISVPITALTQAFDWAAVNGRNGRGLASFVSSGNGGNGSISYPASLPSTIAVGATDHNDQRTTYSQYGTGLDFVAPGGGGSSSGWIWTTDRTGEDGYVFGDYVGITGTSFSAPTAAGIAALMLSVDPNLTADEIRNLMRASADRDKVAGVSFNNDGWNNEYGYGWLNAASAVAAVVNQSGGPIGEEEPPNPQAMAFDDLIGRNDSTGLWWIGRSEGSQITSQPVTAWSTGTEWVDFVSGDFDGDGRADVAARDTATGNIWVGRSTGNGLVTSIWGQWSTTATLSQAEVGDFNGDGRSDLAVRVENDGDGRWYIARSTGEGFLTSPWGGWTTIKTWGQVQTGDFDGDGRTDIAGRIQNAGDGRWVVMQSTGSRFVGRIWGAWSTFVTWDIFTGDVNGDGRTDLIARTGNRGDGRWFISLSTGSSFQNAFWGAVPANLALAEVLVGEFTGDGQADIALRDASDGRWFVIRSRGTDGVSEQWGSWSTTAWDNLLLGDFNGDGLDDIAGRDAATGVWQVAQSTGDQFVSRVWGRWSGGNWSFIAAADVG